MSASATPGRFPSSRVLLVALLVALAFGAAASLLIGAATRSGGPPVPVSELFLPNDLIAGAILGFLGLLVGLFVYQRLVGEGVAVPGRAVVNILVVILLLILLVAVFRVYSGGGPAPTGAVPTGTNSTTPAGSNNSTSTGLPPAGNVTPFLFPTLPTWVPFAVIAAVAVALAVVAVPAARAFVRSRREEQAPRAARAEAVRRVRTALEGAHRQLDLGDDPRRVIVGLYTEFLERTAPLVGWVGPETPEEIRTRHLIALGIRPGAATALTRLFEEARYSSHPMGPTHLARARDAIAAALADLADRPGAAG